MPLKLIRSSVSQSTAWPAVSLDCVWDRDGVVCYTSKLLNPEEVDDVAQWNIMVEQVEQWYATRKRKPSEVAYLPYLGGRRGESVGG